MATRMASRDCEGQSEPINGTMLRDEKKQDTDQITNYASCHFYSCFAKNVCMCVFCVCLFSSFTMVLLFMQACNDCCQCIGCTGGKNMNAFFFFTALTNLTTMLLLHCKAKALKGI